MNQIQPSKLAMLACLLGLGSFSSLRAGQVTYDFKTDPTTGTNAIKIIQTGFADSSGTSVYWKPEGGNPDGFLGITWPIGSSSTIAVFPDIDPGKVVTAFTFECDLRIGSPQQNERPADGFSINFARSTDPAIENPDPANFAVSGAVETGTSTGISIGFDTWAGNALPDGADIEGIIVRVDNKTILRQAMPTRNGACDDNTSLQTGPRPTNYWAAAVDAGTLPDAALVPESWTNLCWQHLVVDLDNSAKLSVTYKGRKLLDQYQTTFFPSSGAIILAGRTGNADEHTHFDNLKLTTTASADTNAPTAPGAITVGATTAGKVVLTWGAATDDSNRVGYNLERDGVIIGNLLTQPSFTDLNVQGGETYSYRVQAVDPVGNKSAFTTAVTATTPASAPVESNGLLFEVWNNITGTAVNLLTDDPRYQTNAAPDFRALATAADTRTVYSDDAHDNYGGRLSGLLAPTESGNYEFFLRSDDASQLYLSPDANTNNLALVAEETGCCAAFQETGDPRTSAPIALTAGQRYAIQVLWKEGGGGDFAQVAWRKSGDTNAASHLKPIPGAFLRTQWDPTVGQPAFTTRPTNITVAAGGTGTFSVTAIGDQPISYQWSLLGTNLVGATNTSFTLNNFVATNVGIYKITASNAVGSVSAVAGIFPKGALFVEAEDFNYGGGNYVTNQPTGVTGPYPGDAYRGLGTADDEGIDYHADGAGAQPYRADTNADADKENQQADWFPRGDFDVVVNNVLGWNDAGEWYNYTRQFPTTGTNYNVIGRLASGGAAIHVQMDEVTGTATSTNQTLKKLGEFRPGRATAGWDNYEFFPLVDDAGNLATVTNWTGVKTFRVTMLPDSAEDMDYFMFVPAGGDGGPPVGNTFASVTRSGTNLVLTWTAGTLESADNVTGPWTAVANGTSPATVPITGTAKFYRLR